MNCELNLLSPTLGLGFSTYYSRGLRRLANNCRPFGTFRRMAGTKVQMEAVEGPETRVESMRRRCMANAMMEDGRWPEQSRQSFGPQNTRIDAEVGMTNDAMTKAQRMINIQWIKSNSNTQQSGIEFGAQV